MQDVAFVYSNNIHDFEKIEFSFQDVDQMVHSQAHFLGTYGGYILALKVLLVKFFTLSSSCRPGCLKQTSLVEYECKRFLRTKKPLVNSKANSQCEKKLKKSHFEFTCQK